MVVIPKLRRHIRLLQQMRELQGLHTTFFGMGGEAGEVLQEAGRGPHVPRVLCFAPNPVCVRGEVSLYMCDKRERERERDSDVMSHATRTHNTYVSMRVSILMPAVKDSCPSRAARAGRCRNKSARMVNWGGGGGGGVGGLAGRPGGVHS